MIISGDHEYRAQTLADIEVNRETGTLEEMKAVFVENVTNAIDGVTGDPAVTDALAFIVTRDSANQIDVQRVELMRTSEKTPDVRSVVTDHLRYQFQEQAAWRFYGEFCEMTEVMFIMEYLLILILLLLNLRSLLNIVLNLHLDLKLLVMIK
jgi:hypothetical protein